MIWKETVTSMTKDFVTWGYSFTRKQLPEIAMDCDCTSLFFLNWLDDPETEKTLQGFLRVLGYVWRKFSEEKAVPEPWSEKAVPAAAIQVDTDRKMT